MKITHFTNTFLPHVGGVARAVQTLLEDQLGARHRVLVVAPEFNEGNAPARIEQHVERLAALTHFNDSDFSVRLPLAATFSQRLADFDNDIIHAHHPFLLGDTALRESASRQLPVVFTHHTLYENYTHYLPFESEAAGDMAADIATRFANRCDVVIAPSESVRELIVSRGVTVPVHVIPTGIDTARIATGDRGRGRARRGIPDDAHVIGHIGRLAPEKNLGYLAESIALALKKLPAARALIVGGGPSRKDMRDTFAKAGVLERVVFTGKLSGRPLLDAYAAMDVFAFASTSETQGLVLAEAMAAGNPVVAIDAPGVREVVVEGRNGRLLPAEATAKDFAYALTRLLGSPDQLKRRRAAALKTAAKFDRRRTTARLLRLYRQVIRDYKRRHRDDDSNALTRAIRPIIDRVSTEAAIIADKTGALIDACTGEHPKIHGAA